MYNQQQESTIYDLIPPAERRTEKAPKHISKFKTHVKGESQQKKDDHKTMGQAKIPVPTTDNYLKKRSHEPQLPDKKEFHYPDEERRRPPVPTKDEKPLMGLKTTKNFISTNAVENITSVPRKPEKKYCDTRIGDKHLIDPSGLEPVYTQKKDFGKIPDYLTRRKDDMDKAQQEYENYVAEHFRRGAMKQLSEKEREQILNGLKANWEMLHHDYQGLSVVTDTASKKNRKERMEAEMKNLESYIETIGYDPLIGMSSTHVLEATRKILLYKGCRLRASDKVISLFVLQGLVSKFYNASLWLHGADMWDDLHPMKT